MNRPIAIVAVVLSALLMLVWVPASWAADPAADHNKPAAQIDQSAHSGAQLFDLHCAGCHAQGGNIVRRGKNLKLKALRQYGMDSAEAISQIVAQGKGNMSAYQDRLTPDEIQAVAAYVLKQAEQGWK